MKNQGRFILFFSLTVLVAACASRDPVQTARTSTQVQMGSNKKSTQPIPTQSSVTQVNPVLIGSYSFWQGGCETPDGMIPYLLDSNSLTQNLIIQNQALIREFYDSSSGCEVKATYSILGIDSKTIVLGNLKLSDTSGECSYIASVLSASGSGNLSLEYVYDYTGLTIYSASAEPCDPDQREVKIFDRL
jgi:hypothetical protein